MLLPVFVICTLRLLSHCSNKIHTIKTAQFLSFKTGCSYPRITVSSVFNKCFYKRKLLLLFTNLMAAKSVFQIFENNTQQFSLSGNISYENRKFLSRRVSEIFEIK